VELHYNKTKNNDNTLKQHVLLVLLLFALSGVVILKNDDKKKNTKKRERKLTFEVLAFAHSTSSWLAPPLSTLLKVLPSLGF